jgi:hypothetical protein
MAVVCESPFVPSVSIAPAVIVPSLTATLPTPAQPQDDRPQAEEEAAAPPSDCIGSDDADFFLAVLQTIAVAAPKRDHFQRNLAAARFADVDLYALAAAAPHVLSTRSLGMYLGAGSAVAAQDATEATVLRLRAVFRWICGHLVWQPSSTDPVAADAVLSRRTANAAGAVLLIPSIRFPSHVVRCRIRRVVCHAVQVLRMHGGGDCDGHAPWAAGNRFDADSPAHLERRPCGRIMVCV